MNRDIIRNILRHKTFEEAENEIWSYRHTRADIENFIKGIPRARSINISSETYEDFPNAVVFDVEIPAHIRLRNGDFVVLLFIQDLHEINEYLLPFSTVLNYRSPAQTMQYRSTDTIERNMYHTTFISRHTRTNEPYMEVLLKNAIEFITPVIVRLFISENSDMDLSDDYWYWDVVDKNITREHPYESDESDTD